MTAQRVLESADGFVVKVGGDSAGQFLENARYPDQMRAYAGRDAPVGMVVSAVRSSSQVYAPLALVEREKGFNTTSHLVAMAEAAEARQRDKATQYVTAVDRFTRQLILDRLAGQMRGTLLEAVDFYTQFLRTVVGEASAARHYGADGRFLRAGQDQLFARDDGTLASFIAWGEDLAEELVATHGGFRSMRFGTPAAGYLDVNRANFDPSRARSFSRDALTSRIEEGEGVWVMGGALPGFMDSRGYSDVAAVAALNAWRKLQEGVLVVAKESPIMSVDPRVSSKGKLVTGLTLSAATELFGTHGMDAAALHPDAVKNLAHPCVVFNPGHPEKGMTVVSCKVPVQEGVLVVGSKPIPALVRVKSPDMADRHGVFDRVMAALRESTLSHTYTTEGSIIVTANGKVGKTTLDELERRLREDLHRSYTVAPADREHAMVFALGNALHGAREVGRACTALDNAGIRVHFQDLVTEAGVMKFVVDKDDAKRAVGTLHEVLVENAATLPA